MIYYLSFLTVAILLDLNDLRATTKKSDIIFYLIMIVLTILISIYHYSDVTKSGIAEYVVKWLKLK